ncbi:tyrosine recombinase XerC [Chitinasiproducens palmae]|uniref:Tyrosine recombinase XerC n=1 Tax=Chitinasiproducens palmae TaxID=1770053 RepID=A0A1H2PT97_9BURK|nr:tyrosine recombinase XerC [Chitinasiproducens palmae]SDV50305.1 integrase/recombinase XerC [Chitinasiproducens palmae]
MNAPDDAALGQADLAALAAHRDSASLHAYLATLENERQYSPHTLRAYHHALAELVRVAESRPLESLTHVDIRNAVARAHGGGLGARSIAHRLSVWRGFFRWLALNSPTLAANPVDGVRAPKRRKALPKALSTDDARTLMEAGADDVSPEALRDRAMLELFYSSGLRLAELIGLDTHYRENGAYRSAGWLDLDSAEVVVTGKGGKRRAVPVGSKALSALRAWLAVRDTMLRDDPNPLFVSTRGARLAPASVRQRVKRLAQAAGIPANVHPHVLRHSFASHVLQSSGDLRAVQDMLGHASIAATQVYTSLDFQYLSKIYDNAHPRARKRDGES